MIPMSSDFSRFPASSAFPGRRRCGAFTEPADVFAVYGGGRGVTDSFQYGGQGTLTDFLPRYDERGQLGTIFHVAYTVEPRDGNIIRYL